MGDMNKGSPGKPVPMGMTIDREGQSHDTTCCDFAEQKWKHLEKLKAAVKTLVYAAAPFDSRFDWSDAIQLRYCPHCGTKYPEKGEVR